MKRLTSGTILFLVVLFCTVGAYPQKVTAASAPQPAGTTIHNIQSASQKWDSFGQHGPKYVDCHPSPCEGISWSMKHGVASPSLTNDATEFDLGGTTPYGDALFTTELIGTNTPKLKDASHTLLPTLHTFTYDTDFYVSNLPVTKTLEFDITLYMQGDKMVWGTQCSHLGDHDWDLYDSANHKWISAGVPCEMVNGWNHLTIHAERGTGNSTIYDSIILDGKTYELNTTYGPGTANASWWGLTVNYQMDGDNKQDANTTYLDNFSLTYQ